MCRSLVQVPLTAPSQYFIQIFTFYTPNIFLNKYLKNKKVKKLFKFSKKSKNILNTVNKELTILANEVLKISKIDFAITDGLRSTEEQQNLYKLGKSKCDGLIKKSKHQLGKAIDIMCYDKNNKGTWDFKYYEEISKLFKQKAVELNIKIKWGGDWVNFKDGVHFELV